MDEEIQQLNEWKDQLILLAAEKGAQFVAAILIVIIGFWLPAWPAVPWHSKSPGQ